MRIVNKIKKGIVFALAFIILISVVPNIAEAARYKDVPEMIDNKKNWAYEYVERATDLGYFKGTSKDKFSPDGILTFEQAIVLLGRFTNPTSEDQRKANIEYNSFLNELDMSQWVKEDAKVMTDMAIAMYRNVISKEEFKNVYENKKGNKPITKVATSMYLVRSMGLAEEAESRSYVSLTYKDALSMSAIEIKYLSVLIEAGVLDPRGSGSGLFEPKSSLRRDVMAKMMSTAHDYLEGNPDIPKDPSKPEDKEEPEETEKITSVIVSPISKVGNKNFIIVDDGKGKKGAYEILSDTSITLDGKATTYLGLSEGQEVELIIKKGTMELISIKALSIEKEISGTIKYVSSSTNKLTIDYIVDGKTVSDEYNVDKDAYIYLNGQSSNLKDLNEGDKIKVKIKNGVIYDIEVESKTQKLEGIIEELTAVKDSRDKEYNITIIDSKDKAYKFLINEDTLIYRNNRRTYEPTDLKVKDEAYIIAEHGVVVEIDAKVVRRRVQGIITGMNIRLHEKPEMTILNKETKKEETYILGQTPYIRVDGKVTNTFDLKVGYYVDLFIEGDVITELDADSRGLEVTIMGTVSHISARTMEMTLTIENFDLDSEKFGDEITVYLTSDTVVADRGFNVKVIADIRRGDRVNVVGIYDGNSIIADTIQLR